LIEKNQKSGCRNLVPFLTKASSFNLWFQLMCEKQLRKRFNSGKTEFFLVGDDDSGPEDLKDDLDLECVAVFRLAKMFT
jgi:hypothetical protein